jgi:hypothetical protein
LAAHTRITAVTWTKDVGPILAARCLNCHGDTGAAQPRLVSYEEAKEQAAAIRREVLENRMPPWPPAHGIGRFRNDRSLTPIEIELLAAWTAGNTPLGPAVTAPQRSNGDAALYPGTPLTVTIPTGHPAHSAVERFDLDSARQTARWIGGWSVQPGDASVVERAVVLAGDQQVGAWLPGDDVVHLPAGVAQAWPAGARLSVELHYRRTLVEQAPAGTLTLFLGTSPRLQVVHRQLACASTRLPTATRALAITPLASAASASFEAIATTGAGRIEPLVVIPRYSPADVLTYRFRSVLPLPAGSRIEVRSSAPECSAVLDTVEPVTPQPGRRP